MTITTTTSTGRRFRQPSVKLRRARREQIQQQECLTQQILKANEPLGSGAIQSTCRQCQSRFKRTGHFWSTAGDEALMCLETCWRNGRWHEPFPNAEIAPPHLN